MELKEEIRMSMEYGYSKQEIFDTMCRKGYSETDLIPELESLYPSLKPINKMGSQFIFLFAGILLFSLSYLIGFFAMDEFQYIFYTVVFLFLSFEFYRLKKYALIIWAVLLGLVDLLLLILSIALLLGAELNSTYAGVIVCAVFLFISALLYYIWDVIRYNRKYVRSLLQKSLN